MIRFHKKREANLTVAALPVPVSEARHFGIIEVDENWCMTGFVEKRQSSPRTMPGQPEMVLASMGNYIFNRHPLEDMLQQDSQDGQSVHDFGRDMIPKMYPGGKVYVYDFSQNIYPVHNRKRLAIGEMLEPSGVIGKRIWIWLVLSHSSISTINCGLY